jgi:hypothetical protein
MSKPFYMKVRDFKDSPETCNDCNEKSKQRLIKYRAAAGLNWSFDTVKEYFENNPPSEGQELLIHDTGHNINTYALVTVKVASSGKQKRIIIEGYTNGYSGESFYRSGKNCFAPKGQARLLPHNSQIILLIKNVNGNEIRLSSEEVYELFNPQ